MRWFGVIRKKLRVRHKQHSGRKSYGYCNRPWEALTATRDGDAVPGFNDDVKK
jgi:hypothetical protein